MFNYHVKMTRWCSRKETFYSLQLWCIEAIIFGFAHSGNANTAWIQFISTYTATKTNPLVELLSNPSFESSLSIATGWTAWCASSCRDGTAGNITINGCRSGICYIDSCNGGGVDYFAQRFPAIIGRAYNIFF